MTKVRVWLSHDGFRDPDDNLAMLVGSAQARTVAKASGGTVSVGGFVYGDTIDGGQFHMLRPMGATPAAFDGDPRFDELAKNKVAAGNYAFYQAYGAKAIAGLAPGWDRFDLLAEDPTGLKAWNFAARTRSEMTAAAWELADDIRIAVARGGASPNEVVVYSAGGGAHVPAEAIAYLLSQGFSQEALVRHFAVVQHGRSNWWLNQAPEATAITRPFTIALSEQDPNVYANGMSAPGLKWLARQGVFLEGDRFGVAFAKATAVAQGVDPFGPLPANRTFKATTDGSDAGSHAFAADVEALLAAWGNRMRPGEDLPYRTQAEHLIEDGASTRLRVIYDAFDWRDARALMNAPAAAARSEAPAAVEVPATAPAGPIGVAMSGVAGSLVAFGGDGALAEVGSARGRIGVADIGDPETVDYGERLVVLLDDATDSIVLRLAGLSSREGFHEVARVSAYDVEGELVTSLALARNGAHGLQFDTEIAALALEADPWSGTGRPPAGDPDFSLIGIDLL